MTFCILGHCPETDQTGIAYTTVTLAGGGTSPFYSYGGDIVVVQAYGNLNTAVAGARALDGGCSLSDTLEDMAQADSSFEFRQVGIMCRNGRSIVRTGDKARPWAGHEHGAHYVSMGNVLAGPEVVSAMARAFRASAGEVLAERLLRGIEAGRDAGGQRAPTGHYDERSALLKIMGAGPAQREVPAMDLRVDMESDAVSRMREMFEIYKPVISRRANRAANPASDLPTSEWEASNMTANPPPPALKAQA